MVCRSSIDSCLENLNSLLKEKSPVTVFEPICKAALMELSGWVEDAFKDICKGFLEKLDIDAQLKEWCLENIGKKNMGDSFRLLLSQLVGLEGLHFLEKKIDFSKLNSLIGTIKTSRDVYAHSHRNIGRKGTTPNFLTPEIIKVRILDHIYPIFEQLEQELQIIIKHTETSE